VIAIPNRLGIYGAGDTMTSKKQEAAARLGSIGGSAKSARKTAANRINGKKGGRPKKVH